MALGRWRDSGGWATTDRLTAVVSHDKYGSERLGRQLDVQGGALGIRVDPLRQSSRVRASTATCCHFHAADTGVVILVSPSRRARIPCSTRPPVVPVQSSAAANAGGYSSFPRMVES